MAWDSKYIGHERPATFPWRISSIRTRQAGVPINTQPRLAAPPVAGAVASLLRISFDDLRTEENELFRPADSRNRDVPGAR